MTTGAPSPVLRQLCLAATVTHFLPGAGAVLRWPEGEERVVGRHPSCDLHPCCWRDAVIQSAAAASLAPHELTWGLAGSPEVDVVPGRRDVDLGAGVFRCDAAGCIVDVFATTLSPPAVHEARSSCLTLPSPDRDFSDRDACDLGSRALGLRRDELTGVTLVYVQHAGTPDDGDVAFALAASCAVAEVCLTA